MSRSACPGAGETATSSHLRLLHALSSVNDLLDTGRQADRERAVAHVADRVGANPRSSPAHPMAWHDETTARRSLTLVRLHDQLTHAEHKPDNATLRWLESLLDTQQARMTASTRLLDDSRTTIDHDGVHLEHAAAYHDLIATNAVKDARFLDAFGLGEQAMELREIHERMARYATHILQPDGTWPLISDTFPRDAPRDGNFDGPLPTELGPHGDTMDDPVVACGYTDLANNEATVEGIALPRVDDHLGATRITSVEVDDLPWRVAAINERLDEVTFARALTFDPQAGRIEVTDTVTGRERRVGSGCAGTSTVPGVSASVDGRWCAGRGAVRTVLTAACHIRRSCPTRPAGPG